MEIREGENQMFELAVRFIQNTRHPVFLTGKAGTGKTTFLKYIRDNSRKVSVIVAPTGVAAINAGGVTIHSFFQVPFAPYIPSNRSFLHNRTNDFTAKLRISAERRELMQKMELLIIDEISMVRCDVLDAIDAVLRFVRNYPAQPFGGVQVLLIGDLYQLPPVHKATEWDLLKQHYDSPYFFSSHAYQCIPAVTIELNKVYRQTDHLFIEILNKVRNNEMDQPAFEILHKRLQPNFTAGEKDDFITLTTHNEKADVINNRALHQLPSTEVSFKAIIEGLFPDNVFPAENNLLLKTGAKVMFIKNDAEKIRRYYNGKIGTINSLEDDRICVCCEEDGITQLIEVKKETWQNIRYHFNEKTRQAEEEVLGTFTQFPLRLAWAITIHKSQGLTFKNAIIDAGAAFTAGQVYVALSRCTSLEGLILKSKIPFNRLQSDERVVNFSAQESRLPSEMMIEQAEQSYQRDILTELFSFNLIERHLNDLISWDRQKRIFNDQFKLWLAGLKNQIDGFVRHGNRFSEVLQVYFTESPYPLDNEKLKERTKSAAVWFIQAIDLAIPALKLSPAYTDNRQFAVEYQTLLQKLFDELSFKRYLLDACSTQVDIPTYRNAVLSFKKEYLTVSAHSAQGTGNVPDHILYPALYNILRDTRNRMASENNIPVFMVCSTFSLEEMANSLPFSRDELEMIGGLGSRRIKTYGDIFLEQIRVFCETHGIVRSSFLHQPAAAVKRPKKKSIKKADTKAISFELFKAGKSAKEIAEERKLSVSTIEGHLTNYVRSGEIALSQLISRENEQLIKKTIADSGFVSLSAIKEKLPEAIGYAEIKWVLAVLNNQENPV